MLAHIFVIPIHMVKNGASFLAHASFSHYYTFDRLVGYTLTDLVWKKVGMGLTAGRVQSPALYMVVER